MCPHRRAFALSDGFVGGLGEASPDCKESRLYVSCPVYKRNLQLNGDIDDAKDKGRGSCSTDTSVSVATFEAEERDDGLVYLKLSPVGELDTVLGTSKWVVKESSNPFENMDKKSWV
jgi:nitrite reductase (NAD(P)H)